jgi:hypothetical protein
LVAPSWILGSGRGFWLLWQLDEAVKVDGGGPLTERVESYGRGIAKVLGSDSVQNIDRIVRLPGGAYIRRNLRWERKNS